MLLAKYPEAQRKAQKELDRVIGRERLPKFEDQSDLTYTMALVREVQRYRPIIPGGLPHATSEDDTWNGYHIPKGAYLLLFNMIVLMAWQSRNHCNCEYLGHSPRP